MNNSNPQTTNDSCRGRCDQGDSMHGQHRRERWHMKMHRMGGHGRGMGRGGGRPGGRALGHGDLRLLILSLIAETPRHGYDLIQEIETRTGGTYKPSPGVMYPALEIIQDLGWAEVRQENGKKTFHITAEGEAELVREAATIEAVRTRLADLLRADESADPTDIRSAMHRLRHAVISAARETSADEARQRRIVEILAAAKDEIAGLG